MILSRIVRRLAAILLLALLAASPAALPVPARATVNSAVNKTIALGDGITTTFNFSFIGVAAQYISVILTDSSGNETVLTQGSDTTQYQITLNPPVTGAIWGLGGRITYNPSGTPIPSGSTLTIFRTLPLTQAISLQNQNSLSRLGNGAETGLDIGVMQTQQQVETLNRAIVAPIVDATPPAPLPPIAQRANMGAAFDSQGNLVAGATPSGGIISSAMQPVVNAATLANGRTALGLGNIAIENIGGGLEDDGAGNVRVNGRSVADATNQNVVAAFHLTQHIATGPVAYTLPRANTLWNGFSFLVYSVSGVVTLVPNAADTILGSSSGTTLTFARGIWYTIDTDAAASGIWYVRQGRAPLATVSTSQLFLGEQSVTYTTPPGARQIRARYCGGGGASGPNTNITSPSGAASSFNGIVAAGGGGGTGNNGAAGGQGGAGGSTASTSTALIRRFAGSNGETGAASSITTVSLVGSRGGSSVFFGGGGVYQGAGVGGTPTPNSGGGGGGYSGSGAGNAGGGGAGECVEQIINNPAATYAVVVGGGGVSGGSASIAGAAGQMIVDEYY